MYFKESQLMLQQLQTNPAGFLSYGFNFRHAGDLFSTADDAIWSNMGENLLIKLLAVCNLFSGSNYYINSIFFNALSFWGLFLVYKVTQTYALQNRLLLFLLIFFLPSCLFWNSGIDKDGLLVFFTGILLNAIHRCISEKYTVQRLTIAFVSFAMIMLIRNVNALLLVPAIAAWLVSTKSSLKPWLCFSAIYCIGVVAFFISVYLPDSFNFPLRLAEKQHGFLTHEANTVLPLTPLKPTLESYCQVFPEAVNHVLLRPYITEIKTPFHLMAFAEVILVLLVFAFAVFTARKTISFRFTQPYFLFLIAVALSGLLLIGYTVPFPGAIVRYKALYLVFLLLPFVSAIETNPNDK